MHGQVFQEIGINIVSTNTENLPAAGDVKEDFDRRNKRPATGQIQQPEIRLTIAMCVNDNLILTRPVRVCYKTNRSCDVESRSGLQNDGRQPIRSAASDTISGHKVGGRYNCGRQLIQVWCS